jgi:hypothetical protein
MCVWVGGHWIRGERFSGYNLNRFLLRLTMARSLVPHPSLEAFVVIPLS